MHSIPQGCKKSIAMAPPRFFNAQVRCSNVPCASFLTICWYQLYVWLQYRSIDPPFVESLTPSINRSTNQVLRAVSWQDHAFSSLPHSFLHSLNQYLIIIKIFLSSLSLPKRILSTVPLNLVFSILSLCYCTLRSTLPSPLQYSFSFSLLKSLSVCLSLNSISIPASAPCLATFVRTFDLGCLPWRPCMKKTNLAWVSVQVLWRIDMGKKSAVQTLTLRIHPGIVSLNQFSLPRVFELKVPPLPAGLMCACCKPSETDLDDWWPKLNPSILEYKGEEDSTCFWVDNPCSVAHLPNSHCCGAVVLFEPKLRRMVVPLMANSSLKVHES